MRKVFTLTLTLIWISSAMMFVTAASAADAEKKVLLKVPTCFPTALPALGDPILYMSKRLELISGGSMRMKVYEPGKLVAPFEILDAVSRGKINAGYSLAAYWQGKMPAAPFFSAIPFGPEAGEFLAWLYYGNGLKLWQQMYDENGYNVKVLPCSAIAPETSGWFADEINSLDDLKGMRMRFFGFGGLVMQKLGVSTSLLPGGEIFPALEKGAIDATEYSMPAIDQRLGFYKVVKYNYYPGWHQQATIGELLVNKDVWNAMSARQQEILQVLCRASITESFAHAEAIQGPVIRENVERRGVTNKYWSDEFLNAFKGAWLQVVEEQCAKNPYFKKVWDDYSAFHKDYAYWSARGFMPRDSQ